MMGELLKDRFSISADELEHRMQLQQKYHDEPLQKAVQILEAALDKVLTKLGVVIEFGDIPSQQDALGIIITEETREELAGINGFFIFLARKGDIIPYCWIGAAQLNNMGECSCQIHYFQDERLEVSGGVKIFKTT
jgi:hypothetical protein